MLVINKFENFILTKHTKNYRLCSAKSRLKYLLDKKKLTYGSCLGSMSYPRSHQIFELPEFFCIY